MNRVNQEHKHRLIIVISKQVISHANGKINLTASVWIFVQNLCRDECLYDDVMTCKIFPHYWPSSTVFPLQRTSNAVLWCFLFSVIGTDCLTNNRVASDLRRRDARESIETCVRWPGKFQCVSLFTMTHNILWTQGLRWTFFKTLSATSLEYFNTFKHIYQLFKCVKVLKRIA